MLATRLSYEEDATRTTTEAVIEAAHQHKLDDHADNGEDQRPDQRQAETERKHLGTNKRREQYEELKG